MHKVLKHGLISETNPHAAQAMLLPVAFEACPTEQSRQPKLPLELLYVPLGHFRQVACPVSV